MIQKTVERHSPTIFERLEKRGVDYFKAKGLVTFDLPHAALSFDTHFGRRTPPQILLQAERVRDLLRKDFLLSSAQKTDIQKTLVTAEVCAWRALIESSFPKLGPWNLSQHFGRARDAHEPNCIPTDILVVAIHQDTGEKREALVPTRQVGGSSWCAAWRKAFAALRILDLALKLTRLKRLVSRRHLQAWPIYTKRVIPRLYDLMAPHYRKRGNIWSAKEKALQRDAFSSKELLQDMLDILKQEHPDVFVRMNINQLKAAVHRHVGGHRKSTESAK